MLAFIEIRNLGDSFSDFLFLQVRKLDLLNIIKKERDSWHHKPVFTDSLPQRSSVLDMPLEHGDDLELVGLEYGRGTWAGDRLQCHEHRDGNCSLG